jgi:hypothetical protein
MLIKQNNEEGTAELSPKFSRIPTGCGESAKSCFLTIRAAFAKQAPSQASNIAAPTSFSAVSKTSLPCLASERSGSSLRMSSLSLVL